MLHIIGPNQPTFKAERIQAEMSLNYLITIISLLTSLPDPSVLGSLDPSTKDRRFCPHLVGSVANQGPLVQNQPTYTWLHISL